MISIQKTESQKFQDLKERHPERVEALQEELELEKEKKEIISSLYDDWIYEYNVREKKVITISGNSSQYAVSKEGGAEPTYLMLDDLHPDDKMGFLEVCRGKSQSSEPSYVEARIKIGGDYRWISLTTRVLSDGEGRPVSVLGKISDIDAKKREELQLQEQAMRDSVTGLLNRTAFRVLTERILAQKEQGAEGIPVMLIADIDNFKSINDTYGHLFGDTVIVSIADALKEVFGEEALIGRFGGDEFTVFLSDVQITLLEEQMIRLKERFAKDIAQTTEGQKITCSIGVAVYGADGITMEELLRNADAALYWVKENGRDGYAFCTEERKNQFFERTLSSVSDEPVQDEHRVVEEITEFAMELLAGSKEFKSALHMLLVKIGKRFRLADVAIREYDEKGMLNVTYLWNDSVKETTVEAQGYIPFEERKNQIVEVADIDTLPEYTDLYRLYKSNGVKALFQCPLVSEGSVFGYITYDDIRIREWNDTEKQSLTMIARIISNYLAREHAYERITHKVELMSSFDEVTGLLKYDKFKEVAQKHLNHADSIQYALVSVDFANFKYFNEVYGFRSGDEVLKDFASLVAKYNPRAVVACRDYADNFLIMVTVKDAESLLNNIKSYNNTFIANQDSKFIDSKLELCCGAYIITDPENGIVKAIDNANIARKILKEKEHAGILLFEPDMKANRMREIAVLHMIEEAIDNSEFGLYLQPKFSLASGRLVGAEALSRWKKPDGEIASPDEFIPPLEKSGKIVQLDFYMYEMMLRQIRRWLNEGYSVVPLSVNLSRHHIKDPQLVEKLVDLLDMYGIESRLVEIEITESAFIEDQAKLIQLMKEFKNRGFGVSIDDFGTGYSSLSMLTELPADIVKLDKEFLKNSNSDSTKGMLQNVIRLIKDNKMDVVCEGVELQEQAEFLAKIGCDIGQGYFFSRPVPVAEFEKLYLKK